MGWRTAVGGLFLGLVALFGGSALAARAVEAPTAISDTGAVRLGVYPDKTRLVLEMSATAPFEVNADAGPSRIDVELPRSACKSQCGPFHGTGLIRGYRIESRPDGGSRLIIETRDAVTVKNAFRMAADGRMPPRLVVDVARTETETPISPPGHGAPPTSAITAFVTPPMKPSMRSAPPPAPMPTPTVAIDPGHGGPDPGAISPTGVEEKDVTLATALETRRQLEATGRYKVFLTRDRDVFLPLRDRVSVARDAGADLFISLHADTIEHSSINGLSIYTLSDRASDHEAEMLAAKENRADALSGINLSSENQDVASILISLAQRDTMNQSNRFAGFALRELGREVNLLPIRPHRQAGFAVLTAPDVPSSLIEMGYLSNHHDLARLTDGVYRQHLAKGLVRAIDDYFKWLQQVRRT